MIRRWLSMFAVLALLVTILPDRAWAQVNLLGPGDEEGAPALPEDLTPDLIDGIVARLDDGEIRALLLEELHRQAAAKAEAAEAVSTFESAGERLTEMSATIRKRTTRWAKALANLDERRDKVRDRLALAKGGVSGMLTAAATLVAAGILSALIIVRLTRPWCRVMADAARSGYWGRVLRSALLFAIEMLPIAGFVVASRVAAAALGPPLGPLNGQVWIYLVGVGWTWSFIVASRRAFAPDAPALRLAPLSDEAAIRLHSVLRRAVIVGAAGWLLAGLSPNLGWGFPPAMVTVALAGTMVAAMLLLALVRDTPAIRTSLLGHGKEAPLVRVAASAVPVGLGVYIIGAWLYWLAHWLERGQPRLEGPAGTLLIVLLLPIADRFGQEIVRTAIRPLSDRAERFRRVLQEAWRTLIGLIATGLIAGMWGLDLLALAKGEDAPAWASAAFDIVVTLLLGHLVWRLIMAALHTELRVSDANEEADLEGSGTSRLETLTPVFRNMLLIVLVVVVSMITLSAIGVDIGPLIASAGIVGIAVGFGAQALVRDIFSGIFFLIDDAFRVGEYIELDKETRGEVEAISVRSLRMRNHRGPVITIPFGELKKIVNHNRDWVIYKMPFRLEPDTDPHAVKKIVKRVGQEFLEHPEHGPKFLEPLKSQGVFSIDDDSALVMRVKFKCLPRAQFVLRREIYHRLRAVFAEEGIRFARRKVEVVGAEDSSALAAAAATQTLPMGTADPA